MDICIQTSAVKKERDLDNVVVSVRLRGAEAARFWSTMDAAKAKNAYIRASDVIRELLGLDPPNILTPAELQHFRSPKEKQLPLKPIAQKGEDLPMVNQRKALKTKNG